MTIMNNKTFDIDEKSHGDNIGEDNFQIDDLIAYPIRTLNLKGYTTLYCCAGHPFGMRITTITFKEGINLPSLPPKFVEERVYNNRLSITREYDYPVGSFKDDFFGFLRTFQRDNIDAMEELYKWALDLPDFKS